MVLTRVLWQSFLADSQLLIGEVMRNQITAAVITLAVVIGGPLSADAAKFKNCTAVNKVYKGGVSKSADIVNAGGKTKNIPTVDAKLYKTIKSMDRDNDGIACEK